MIRRINLYVCIVMAVLLLTPGAGVAAETADELLSRGREAYLDYDFEMAASLYAQAKKKAKRSDEFFADQYDNYTRQLNDARNFLNRVEQIEIIDSLTVPRQDFFRHYRLPASAGSLLGGDALPGRRIAGVDYVFTNEDGDYKLWSEPDSLGNMVPMESTLLTDGSWSDPVPLWDDLSEDSDAIFPFLMADGVTLYYADNGEDSIGGYDIMVATRDAADGSFLQPQNLGFPYNSPYDDYLLAIDELNGVGWWATDRNRLDDELTVYVFVTNEMRRNYDADEEGIIGYARIDDILATQPEDADYDDLLAEIRAIDPSRRQLKAEFRLPAPGGLIYIRYDELPNAQARSAMRAYLSANEELEIMNSELAAMRSNYYSSRRKSLGTQIEKAEKYAETQREKVRRLRSEVYKAMK